MRWWSGAVCTRRGGGAAAIRSLGAALRAARSVVVIQAHGAVDVHIGPDDMKEVRDTLGLVQRIVVGQLDGVCMAGAATGRML